jgi:hypothetical protein
MSSQLTNSECLPLLEECTLALYQKNIYRITGLNLFDLFHGEDAHQRNDLFDKVAETVLQMMISHHRSTGDNKAFVALLRKALKFASGSHVREKIPKNISIDEGNLPPI